MQNRVGRWLLLLGALGFAVLGQFYFARKPDNFWDGIVFYAVAVFCFLLLVQRAGGESVAQADRRSHWSASLVARTLLVVIALSLGVLAAAQSARLRETLTGGGTAWPVFWTWVAAMAVYMAAFGRLPRLAANTRPIAQARGWLAANGWELGLLSSLLLAAFLLRAWRIDVIPWTLGGDEGSQGLWARDVLANRLPNMFDLGWLSVPNMSFYWQAAWFRLLGDGIVGLRLPWAVVGVLTVLGTYLLVRRLFDRPLAVLTAFLLATYHFHIHYSRLGSNQVADPLFMVWALYFIVLGWNRKAVGAAEAQSGPRWAWALSGIIAGLGFYFYAGSRQVLVIMCGVLAWAALTDREFLPRQMSNLLVLLGGFLVSVGPMALLAIRDPNNFNARVNAVGIFQSGWLEREVQITGRSAASLLAEQFRKAFLAFNIYKDRVSWYGPRTIPLMDFVASIFFMLGLAVSAARMLKWRYAVFVIWFVVVIVLGGALTENPPSSQRLVSSAVPAVFFVAIALRKLAVVVRDLLRWPEVGRHAVALAVAVVLAFVSVRFYFGDYQASWVYGNANAEVATRIGYYLRDLGPGWQEYFFGVPRMYADFGSTPFIAKGVPLKDVWDPLTEPPSFADSGLKKVFIFLPERLDELKWVRQAYPGGAEEPVYRIEIDAASGDELPLLFVAYRVE